MKNVTGRINTVSKSTNSLYTDLRKEYLNEWRTWYRMHQMVKDEKWSHQCYVDVEVVPEWHGEEGFIQFLDDLGPRPTKVGYVRLDRINKFGDFSADNCKWATIDDANNNKRWHQDRPERTRWARIAMANGIPRRAFNMRIYLGWNIKDAATLPVLGRGHRYKKRTQ